jgi:hypothetical protein
VSASRPISSRLSSWFCNCHVVCHPEVHVSLNIKEIIITPKPKVSTETRTQDSFRVCALSAGNLLAEKNKFCLGAVLLSCLSFRATETMLVRTRTQNSFQCCGLCSCNLLAETSNFDLGAVLLSCEVSEPQEPPSPGIELRTHFPEFWPCYVFSLVTGNKHTKFGANRYIRSRAISEQTYK